jgi:exonuclease SbcC
LQQKVATLGEIVREIETIERDLNPFLTSAGISPEGLQQDAAGTRMKLQLKATAYRELKEQIVSLECTVQELKPQCAEAATILLTTGELLTRSQAGLATRNEELEDKLRLANDHLSAIGPRYQLAQGVNSDLAVHVVDRDMADELRAARSLSGGERFLVSLSLALALSGLEGRSSFVDTLFIDEGFGSLDQETLDIALDALESLHSRGRKVAVITHVAAMIDRIVVQVRVENLAEVTRR